MQKDWKIDGRGLTARKPNTYKEIGRAVGLLLEERQDIHASSIGSDQFMAVNDPARMVSGARQPNHGGGAVGGTGGGPRGATITCGHCHATDNHYMINCPQKAAETRGEYEGCMSRYKLL